MGQLEIVLLGYGCACSKSEPQVSVSHIPSKCSNPSVTELIFCNILSLLFTLHELVRVFEAKKKEVWVTQSKTGEGMASGHQGMYPSPPAVVPK